MFMAIPSFFSSEFSISPVLKSEDSGAEMWEKILNLIMTAPNLFTLRFLYLLCT